MGAGLAQQFVNSQSPPEVSARRLRNAEASEFSAATIEALRSVLVGGPTSPRSGHGGANGFADAYGSLCIVLLTGHGDVLGLTYRLAIFRNSNSASRARGGPGAPLRPSEVQTSLLVRTARRMLASPTPTLVWMTRASPRELSWVARGDCA